MKERPVEGLPGEFSWCGDKLYQRRCQKVCSALSSPPEVIYVWWFTAIKPHIMYVLPPFSQGGQQHYASGIILILFIQLLKSFEVIYAELVWF